MKSGLPSAAPKLSSLKFTRYSCSPDDPAFWALHYNDLLHQHPNVEPFINALLEYSCQLQRLEISDLAIPHEFNAEILLIPTRSAFATTVAYPWPILREVIIQIPAVDSIRWWDTYSTLLFFLAGRVATKMPVLNRMSIQICNRD